MKQTIEDLREEIKELIAETEDLNNSVTWWKNKYEAQVKINEEHQRINGELRKENDGLITVIDLAKEFIFNHSEQYKPHFRKINLNTADCTELLNILDKANESEVN